VKGGTASRPLRLAERHLRPEHLFLAGLGILPAFLFQGQLWVRAAQVFLFMALAFLCGRRIRLLPPALLTLSIVAANLATPYGKVLLSVWGLPVTLGALQTGLLKATTMVGLFYLSLVTVRPELRLPGRFGGLLARMIYYFELIMEDDKRFDRRDPFGGLDALLIRVHGEASKSGEGACGSAAPAGGRRSSAARTTPAGLAAMLLLGALNWGALVLS